MPRSAGTRAPTPQLPPTARVHYPALDSVRAVGALMVLGYHVRSSTVSTAAVWDGGKQLNIGVAVFFVLSAFLLYRPFATARLHGRPPPGLRRYGVRRLFRIIPAYWVVLTVLALALPAQVQVFDGRPWTFYGLVQTWIPGETFKGLAPAWSLSVEAAFYLLLPLYALLARRLWGKREPRQQVRTELIVLAVVCAATLLARRYAFGRGAGPYGFLVWSLLGHLDWFACGLALATASVWWRDPTRRPRPLAWAQRREGWCWVMALALFLLFGFVKGNPGDCLHIGGLVIASLMVAPVVFAEDGSGPIQRLLGTAVMRWLGTVSYGIFLWNEPFPAWLNSIGADDWGVVSGALPRLVLTVLITVPLAAATFYLVERPAMRLSRGRRAVTPPTG